MQPEIVRFPYTLKDAAVSDAANDVRNKYVFDRVFHPGGPSFTKPSIQPLCNTVAGGLIWSGCVTVDEVLEHLDADRVGVKLRERQQPRNDRERLRGMAVTLVSEKTKVRGLSAREVYTVKQNQTQSAPKKKDFVTLVDAHGKEHKINVRANGEKLELGAIGEIELQAGDRLWFRANSSGVTNGTLPSLAGTDEQERLVTTDGFVVPEDYLKIAHGYATTSHSSQGLTANFAVVFGASFDQKAIYVSHSRARERVDTYVPSKEAFLTRAERAQGERLGVLEAIANATKEQGGEMLQELKIGDEVNWLYEPRGGYGSVTPVAGAVGLKRSRSVWPSGWMVSGSV